MCIYTDEFFNEKYNGSKIYLNVIDETTSASNYKPIPVAVSERQLIADHKDYIRIDCAYGGYPKPQILWYVNGTEDKDYRNNDKYYMWGLDFSDSGEYACKVSNGVGPEIFNNFTVIVKESLYFTDRQNSVTKLEESIDVQFQCSAVGVPPPTYEWFVNGKPIGDVQLNERWMVTPNKITISKVQFSDMCVIGCVARSGDRELYAENYLRVLLDDEDY